MPELPEVQSTADELKKELTGVKIVNVWSDWQKLVQRPNFTLFKKQVKNEKILNVSRRAKIIVFYLSHQKLLLAHQKMTGHFLIGRWRYLPKATRQWQPLDQGPLQDKINSFFHLVFFLDNGKQLAFSDLRKFGWVKLYQNTQLQEISEIKSLGPEPLAPSLSPFLLKKQLTKTSRPIKQVLMDQKIIAGIGNIYGDEILFLAKIHPLKPANQLRLSEINKLYHSIQVVLRQAIELKGTTILSGSEEYRLPQGQRGKYQKVRKVYRREGKACLICQNRIKRIKIGQRSAHFCPQCQAIN